MVSTSVSRKGNWTQTWTRTREYKRQRSLIPLSYGRLESLNEDAKDHLPIVQILIEQLLRRNAKFTVSNAISELCTTYYTCCTKCSHGYLNTPTRFNLFAGLVDKGLKYVQCQHGDTAM